jgi:tripartite-type tricarboxylate transporter receptor subunit TctC
VLPQVPTFEELGLSGLEDLPYYGVFAPVGTPQPAIDRFGNALAKVLAMPDVKERLTAMGLTVGFMPQGQFAGAVRSYTQTWAQIIKASGFQPQ